MRCRRVLLNEPSAKSILVQRHLGGLARLPETRCFFVGGEFAYAAGELESRLGKKFDLTSCPESASSRDLPAKYWRPHAALAKRVLDEVLPPLYSFDRKTATSARSATHGPCASTSARTRGPTSTASRSRPSRGSRPAS